MSEDIWNRLRNSDFNNDNGNNVYFSKNKNFNIYEVHLLLLY